MKIIQILTEDKEELTMTDDGGEFDGVLVGDVLSVKTCKGDGSPITVQGAMCTAIRELTLINGGA